MIYVLFATPLLSHYKTNPHPEIGTIQEHCWKIFKCACIEYIQIHFLFVGLQPTLLAHMEATEYKGMTLL